MFCPRSSDVLEPTREHAYEPQACQPNEATNRWTHLCLGDDLQILSYFFAAQQLCFDSRSSINLYSVSSDADVPRRCDNAVERAHLRNAAFRQGGANHKKENHSQRGIMQSISSQVQLIWCAELSRGRPKTLLAKKTCTRNATCMFNVWCATQCSLDCDQKCSYTAAECPSSTASITSSMYQLTCQIQYSVKVHL